MPTGGTHLFPVSYSPVVSSRTTSHVSPMSVKSSFSAFVSDCYTSKGNVKLWNNPIFSVPAFFVMMRLWAIGFSVPVEELVPLQ